MRILLKLWKWLRCISVNFKIIKFHPLIHSIFHFFWFLNSNSIRFILILIIISFIYAMSLIKRRKIISPNKEPWGTSHLNIFLVELSRVSKADWKTQVWFPTVIAFFNILISSRIRYKIILYSATLITLHVFLSNKKRKTLT